MNSQQGSPQQKKTTFAGAMAWIGAFAGFLWGGTVGDADPEIGFWIGALVGAGMGAFGGWIAALTLQVAFQIALIVLALALIAVRVLWFFSALGS